MLHGQMLTGQWLTEQLLIGQLLTNNVGDWTNAHKEKKWIKKKQKTKKFTNLFNVFTFWIMNNDCNERSPKYYIIAIMDTI